MGNIIARAVALMSLALLAACGEAPIPYDRGATPAIHTIGLLTPGWEHTPDAVLAGNVGQNFGLVGALTEAAMKAGRDGQLQTIVTEKAFNARDRFTGFLTTAVAEDGYQVVPISIDRPDKKLLTAFDNIAPADAWLDCAVPLWGYMAAGISDSTPWRPLVVVRCQLVRPGGNKILMRDAVIYNPLGSQSKFVTIAPDPRFQFTTFDMLAGSPDLAVQGLDSALNDTARRIAVLLK